MLVVSLRSHLAIVLLFAGVFFPARARKFARLLRRSGQHAGCQAPGRPPGCPASGRKEAGASTGSGKSGPARRASSRNRPRSTASRCAVKPEPAKVVANRQSSRRRKTSPCQAGPKKPPEQDYSALEAIKKMQREGDRALRKAGGPQTHPSTGRIQQPCHAPAGAWNGKGKEAGVEQGDFIQESISTKSGLFTLQQLSSPEKRLSQNCCRV